MTYSTAQSPNLLRSVFLILPALLLAACSGSSSGGGNSSPAGSGGASVTLSASAGSVAAGGSVVLTWSSSGTSSCTASGGWSGSRAISGSQTVGPINQTSTYTLSCSGEGGGAVRQVTVQVGNGNGVTVNLSASPSAVAAGNNSTLTWSSSGASSCTASGGWSGSRATSGSFTVGPINARTTYQLNCTGAAGNGVGMVTVEVVDKTLRWQAPSQNVDGTPLNDLAGYVIYWGRNSRAYTDSFTINSPAVTEWEATMAAGDYYFAMTAFDSQNNESDYSNEVLKTIPD